MTSHLGKETADERTLFEQAKAKLEEAFALLQSLEGRMQSEVARSPIDAAQRAEERERLLAYVEHAQSEALRLARRSRRLSRIRVRAKAQANAQRAEAPAVAVETVSEAKLVTQVMPAITQLDVPQSQIITEEAKALDPPSRLAPATTRDLEHGSAEDDLDDVDLASLEGDAPSELDQIERAFEKATRELSGRLSAQREITPERIARSRADTLIGRFADLKDEDLEISDAELNAFEASMANATLQHTRIDWSPAAAEGAEQEKAGARMRRDRTPTERMDRPTRRPTLVPRLLTVRGAVIGIAALVLLVIVGFTVRAVLARRAAEVAVVIEPPPFVGPPGELAMPYLVDDSATPVKPTPKARLARDGRQRSRR